MPTQLSIICNAVTPYRIHLHHRIVDECPDISLRSIFTQEHSNAPWKLKAPESIQPVFFGRGEESEKQGFTARPLHEIRKARSIEKYLRQVGVDAVIIFGYNDWCRLHIIIWCWRQRIPCFLFGDSNSLNEVGWKVLVKRLLLSPVLSLCAGAMHCGKRGAEYFSRYGVPADRLFPFPYEPDYDRIASVSVSECDSAMHGFGLPPGRRRILYSGRLVHLKRVDLLIAAFQSLATERPDWDLVIAGDGPECASLSALVTPEMKTRIYFLGFINRPESLAAIYATSDVLVLPSDFEPWGVVVTEAATRLALICSSRVGAAIDLVEDHRNGITFEAGDGASLLAALREVTDSLNIDRMKAASPLVLAAWRTRMDPVAGLRRALLSAGFRMPQT